jgi:hypothetical protein
MSLLGVAKAILVGFYHAYAGPFSHHSRNIHVGRPSIDAQAFVLCWSCCLACVRLTVFGTTNPALCSEQLMPCFVPTQTHQLQQLMSAADALFLLLNLILRKFIKILFCT